MGLTLYHGAISTCSQKVRLALAEKNLAFDTVEIDVPAREHLTEAYLRLNPNGVVPTLVHDGQPIVDSSVICEYLDEVFPDPPLSPLDPVGRAGMRAWMRYTEEVPTAAIRVPSYNRVLVRDFGTDHAERLADLRERSPLRRHFYADLTTHGFSEAQYARSLERLADCLARMDRALVDGRSFLLGRTVTITDLMLLPTLVRMEDIGLADRWAGLPTVANWLARMTARSSFARAFYPGSRLKPT